MDSIILLGQKNTLAEYMILSDADNRPPMLDKDLIKKYDELSAAEKIQVDCDMKATNIILQDRQGLLNATTIKVNDIWLGNALSPSDQGMQHDLGIPNGQAVHTIIPNNAAFQTEDLDSYDSDSDDVSNTKVVLMANISNYGSDVISEVPHSETYLNDMENQKTLILKEVSRSKMAEKHKDPEAIKQKNSNKPINYVKLSKIYEDLGKRFVPQQELSADEAVWYHMLNPSTKSSDTLTVKIEAPKELPKVSLVNESLKNLELHHVNFDKVVKIRTTPNARTEGEWGLNILKLCLTKKLFHF
nr:hypothetical protein [Tanacetum cinerariifolium]